MRRASIRVVLAIAAAALCTSCGGGGGQSDDQTIAGPILSLDSIQAIAVDQLFINGGMEDEYRARGEFSIYLRDAATQKDVACTTSSGAAARVASPDIFYGGLALPLTSLEGDHPTSVARFQIVFVEKDGPDCPAPIDVEDDIVGISDEVSSDELLRVPIWAQNGRAIAVLRAPSDTALSIRSMAPSLADGLIVDKLFFRRNAESDAIAESYYLFAERIENGVAVDQCQLDASAMEGIRFGDVIYAALGLSIPCFDPAASNFADMQVRVGIYVQASSGPELVGQTAPQAIGDVIGERVNFAEGDGYVAFRRVTTTLFGAPVVRLADLTSVVVSSLSHTASPTTDADLELHAVDPGTGLTVACAGRVQGLEGVGLAGSYDALSAKIVAVDGQRELFGWDQVILRLVERSDGHACPVPPEGSVGVLAQTAELVPSDLRAESVSFLSGKGTVKFVRAVAQTN
jgi:hypothetical protein